MTTVTYKMPPDDNAVVTTRGVRFFDGQPVELDPVKDAALIAKCQGNPWFEVSADKPIVKPAPTTLSLPQKV